MVVLPPMDARPTGDKDADIRSILEEINRQLEDAIRRRPEQYLWAHRRWRKSDSHNTGAPGSPEAPNPTRTA